MRRGAAIAAALTLSMLAGCDRLPFATGGNRPDTAADFPSANRPVAPVNSPRWTDEDTRDRLGEADDVMTRAGITPGMTVADIGAGEGYYPLFLAANLEALAVVDRRKIGADARSADRNGCTRARQHDRAVVGLAPARTVGQGEQHA